MKHVLLGLVTLVCLSPALAEHSPLLPHPQEVHYGSGSLTVAGLSIRFAGTPSTEDRFAAGVLATRLAALCQSPIAVQPAQPSEQAVVLNRTGDAAALPTDKDKAGPDSRESYSLRVTPQGVEIQAPGSAGLFYGVQTLLQMVEGTGTNALLPEAELKDWPTLAYRGAMLDFSEGELLRVSEVERQLDLMARFKANQYYFYSEASIELEGYSIVNPKGRYTQAEVKHVIDYARQRHIDVVPCLELYGHMHNLFRYEKYADLGLPRYGGEFDPRNPRMYSIIDNWVEQTTKLFPSPWYHVGFDEPWSLGKIGLVPGKDPFQGFMDVLRHIAEKAGAQGKRLMFWADIDQGASTFSEHPELLKDVPAGAIAVPWIYEERKDYTPFVEPVARMNIPNLVAPGVWAWNELFPDFHRTFFNINELTATGRQYHTLGQLNTTWTDSRQTIYRLTWPGIAFGAVAAWQPDRVNTNTYFKEYCAVVYPPAAAPEVAQALEELSTAQELFTRALHDNTQYSFWADPLVPAQLKKLQVGAADLRQARLLSESAQEHLQAALRLGPEPSLQSMLVSARMFDYLGMKCLYTVEWADYFRQLKEHPTKELEQLYIGNQMNSTTYGMLTDLREMVSELREDYRQAWLDEATPFRLQSALYRWDDEWEYWTAVQRLVVHKVLHAWKEGEPFPAIEVIRPAR